MKGKYEIDIEDFRFYVTVIDYHHQPAQGPSADSDCYGYTDIEWACMRAVEYDEDGYETETTVDIAEYSELIEQELLSIIADEISDQDYDSFDEGY